MKTIPTATITVSGRAMTIGPDFGDAVTGPYRSHGTADISLARERPAMEWTWRSTFPIAESEAIIRDAVKREGCYLSAFSSQALG